MAVRDGQGFVVRWIAAIIDITEHRGQQQALRDSRDQIAAQAALLEQQNEALKENVRLREEVERISRHDIKTPLNSIISVPRLLREEGRLGADVDELLGIVERAGYRILSMVNLSLDLVKMEQGSYIFRPDAVDLEELADKVLADLRLQASAKGIVFDVDLRGADYAWAEELLCYSLLANLLKNAVEASPDGGRVLVLAESGGGSVKLHIHNEGEVPPAIRDRFFEKYVTAGKASGSGLGTYSARLMARVQDGEVGMQSSLDDGTTLTVTLRAAPDGVRPAAARHLSERGRAGRVSVGSLAPQRVLLVDDDEYNLLIVRRYLPTPPFSVDTATDGRMALDAAQRHWPDVVIMDLDMPVMGGLAAVGALRALERQKGAPRGTMIALSSHDDEATRIAALAAGFDHYLNKPVTRDAIHDTLLALDPARKPAVAVVPAPHAAAPDGPVLVDIDLQPALPAYLVSRRALVASLPVALRADDRAELRRLAHQLAGSLGLYGFHWASDQCRWIERHHADVGEPELEAISAALQAHLQSGRVRFVTVDDGFPVSTDPA
jgi:signal transduction histidine kinase/DNA-binding response OmpR family regulator